ncbi:MAG: DEAD/DEAH box helicase, partial [Candidatus Micrarchaeia archaeon]
MKLLTRYRKLRKGQEEMAHDVYNAIIREMNIMVHAPTGIGKTDASLAAAITAATETGSDVLFITPKNSQHKIANDVVKGICNAYNLGLCSSELVGKKHMCNLKRTENLQFEDFYHMCRMRIKNGTCPYYEKAKDGRNIALPEQFNLTHNELCELGQKRGVCAYELAMGAASRSQVIIGDYSHVLMPAIAYPFLKRSGKTLKNSIVIVDEAHNLSIRLREHLSSRMSEKMIIRARKECAHFDSELLSFLEKKFGDWCRYTLGRRDERTVDKEELLKLIELEMQIEELVNELYEIGDKWIEEMNVASACIRIANFIEMWVDDTNEEKFARIVKESNGNYFVEKLCLSPDIVTSKLNEAISAVLMSGTLKPFEMHRDVIGLDPQRTMFREYESPFPKDNCLKLIDGSITTRYSKRGKEEYKKAGKRISELCAINPGNVAVFFPSYEVLRGVLPYIEPGTKEMIVQ